MFPHYLKIYFFNNKITYSHRISRTIEIQNSNDICLEKKYSNSLWIMDNTTRISNNIFSQIFV